MDGDLSINGIGGVRLEEHLGDEISINSRLVYYHTLIYHSTQSQSHIPWHRVLSRKRSLKSVLFLGIFAKVQNRIVFSVLLMPVDEHAVSVFVIFHVFQVTLSCILSSYKGEVCSVALDRNLAN